MGVVCMSVYHVSIMYMEAMRGSITDGDWAQLLEPKDTVLKDTQ